MAALFCLPETLDLRLPTSLVESKRARVIKRINKRVILVSI